ncbi:DoxX family protein [Novosphingobium rhizosphaerae]|uniref:DoxX family protein n=1 Tax=Novosphingobium rhizosphaerae TaxID=1551649 RepID=UPI0017F59A1E|nr:putative membrane protein YphA (DoxX/SURF4 family) [Novosphingobium sp. SG919]NMN87634.1 putative membrane protein YphA (DoxX/SURF4 family) [Novosphingobium sp. SG916]
MREPRFVDAVLDWPPTWFVARLLLVGAYLVGGLAKLADWPGAVAEQAHFGMHPPALWAGITIAVELLGPALILAGRLVWLGAGMLGVFTVLAACTANAFWTMQGAERFAATNAFFEHLGLAGGFVLAALVAEHARREGRM